MQPQSPANYQCAFCRTTTVVEPGRTRSCPACGAPLEVRHLVSDSGWVQLPPVVDMAQIQFGRSTVQIEGTTVPIADFNLDRDDRIYFSHHRLVWADTNVRLETRKDRNGIIKRSLAGMPLFMVAASGPGHVALSDNHAGEIVSIPLAAGRGMWVREHVFLGATDNVGYQPQANGLRLVYRNGSETEYEYPIGQWDDVFFAQNAPGLLLVHSPGNTMFRDLAPGERILVQPRSLLYRDLSVVPSLVIEFPRGAGSSFFSAERRHCWLDLCGPGRVAISSKYEYEPMSTNSLRSGYSHQLRW